MEPDYVNRLRRAAISEAGALEARNASEQDQMEIDSKTLALARLAALVAVGAAESSFGEYTDAALSAGASADEIVDILIGIASVVGTPRVVAAAPRLALALGYDVEDDAG